MAGKNRGVAGLSTGLVAIALVVYAAGSSVAARATNECIYEEHLYSPGACLLADVAVCGCWTTKMTCQPDGEWYCSNLCEIVGLDGNDNVLAQRNKSTY